MLCEDQNALSVPLSQDFNTKWTKKGGNGDKLQHLTRFADPDHVEYFSFSCTLNHFGGQRLSVDEEGGKKSQNHQNGTSHNENA